MLRLSAMLAGLLCLAACTSAPPVTGSPYVATALTPVHRLAVAPGGGALAEAVAAELAGVHGFEIVPADTVFALMDAAGIPVLDGPQLGRLGFLDAQGIDAVLTARGESAGSASRSASVAVLRVPDGARLAEAHWTPRFRRLSDARASLQPGRVSAQLAEGIAIALRR
jgi:hypothetical protein